MAFQNVLEWNLLVLSSTALLLPHCISSYETDHNDVQESRHDCHFDFHSVLGVNAMFIRRNRHRSVRTANKYHLAIICNCENSGRVIGTMGTEMAMKNAICALYSIRVYKKNFGRPYHIFQSKVRWPAVTLP